MPSIRKKSVLFNFNLWLVMPAILFLICFMVVPIIFLVVLGFRDVDASMNTTSVFTLKNYGMILTSMQLLSSLGKSLILSFIVTLICLVLSYPTAFALISAKGWLRTFLSIILISPLLTSVVIRIYSWIVLLSNNGIVNQLLLQFHAISHPLPLLWNDNAVIIAFVQVLLPFAVLPISNSLSEMDRRIILSSMNLGANKMQTFFKIVLPLTIPGLLASSILVFSLTAGSYITPLLMAGNGSHVVAVVIYQQAMQIMNLPLAAALSVILLLLISLITIALTYLGRKWEAKVYGA